MSKQSRREAVARPRPNGAARKALRADRPLAGARAVTESLDRGMLTGLLGYRLRLAQLAVFRDFERSVGDLGVSPGRVGVLVLVEANPGLAQSRLAEAVGLDRSTLVPLIDQFEAEGVLERRPGTDRRTNGLFMTADGKRLLSRIKKRVEEHEARILEPLSAAERATLFTLLERVGVEAT